MGTIKVVEFRNALGKDDLLVMGELDGFEGAWKEEWPGVEDAPKAFNDYLLEYILVRPVELAMTGSVGVGTNAGARVLKPLYRFLRVAILRDRADQAKRRPMTIHATIVDAPIGQVPTDRCTQCGQKPEGDEGSCSSLRIRTGPIPSVTEGVSHHGAPQPVPETERDRLREKRHG